METLEELRNDPVQLQQLINRGDGRFDILKFATCTKTE